MTGRLLTPGNAMAALRDSAAARWAEAVCAEHGTSTPVTFSVSLRPGVNSAAAVDRIGYATWTDWVGAWRVFAGMLPEGIRVEHKAVPVQRVVSPFPASLVADGLDAVHRLIKDDDGVDVGRARTLAASLVMAGATLTPALLRAVYRLDPADTAMLTAAISWVSANPETPGWSARRLRVPGLHTTWLERHGALLRQATGRDVLAEVRARPAVVHLTYVDPDHLTAGRRRHDAWTTGDSHDLAYRPRVVLVVENRDSRLWFPEVPGTIVVEGGGRAAVSVLSGIEWLRTADHLLYWGDMDAEGYATLDRFRSAMAAHDIAVRSILMDDVDLRRYAQYGARTDRNGRGQRPLPARLDHLTPGESAAHEALTARAAPFRRIEQELLPLADAADRLRAVTPPPSETASERQGVPG